MIIGSGDDKMKENLVSLAKLLATDDEFNLAFSSRGTDEEKYELAKTKFTNLTREDFSEFLEKLHEVEKANFAELLPDELELISVARAAGPPSSQRQPCLLRRWGLPESCHSRRMLSLGPIACRLKLWTRSLTIKTLKL